MKKIILIFTVLAFTCLSSECLAQKVIEQTVNYNGTNYTYKAVIDNATLPVDAIKSRLELRNQKVKGTGQMKPHKENETSNQKVSPKFAVASADVSGKKEWADALTACANYKETGEPDGTENVWRVPTQRELMLMCQMKAELEAIDGSKFANFATSSYYWSSTEYGSNYSGYVNFNYGIVNNNFKSSSRSVRCVRDL